MKKRVLMINVIAAMLATGVNAADVKLDAEKLKEIKANTKILQNPTLHLKDAIDKDSVYFLKLEARSQRGSRVLNAFLDKKTGAVYFGEGYDKNGAKMTFPKEAKIIKDGISFSYGTGTKDLYLVTDPECPYCVKFEKELKGKLKEYRVHVILYPLSFHKKAPAMVEWVLQGKTEEEKKERLDQIMLQKSTEYKALITDAKKPFKYTEEVQKSVTKALKAVQELGARGTPATFDAAFNPVPRSALLGTVPAPKKGTPKKVEKKTPVKENVPKK
jgi:thiol:disulfide interchange protein DsbC